MLSVEICPVMDVGNGDGERSIAYSTKLRCFLAFAFSPFLRNTFFCHFRIHRSFHH